MKLFPSKGQWSIIRMFLIIPLTILIIIVAVPGYWNRNWTWATTPKIENIQQFRSILKTGLKISNWNTVKHQQIRLGGNNWSLQIVEQNAKKEVVLLISPQDYYLDKPEVEWIDINGVTRWKTDSYNSLKLQVKTGGKIETITTNFFRAWNSQETFAVVQWYAWPNGGHFSPIYWFWSDRLAQLNHRRSPWVAISIHIPIEPLGDINSVKTIAESLVKEIQTNLNTGVFSQYR